MAKENILPDWLRKRNMEAASKDRRSAFISDKTAFDEDFQAKLDLIQSELGFSNEQFFGGLASRGILQSGEVPAQYARQVMAPLQAQANVAATGAELGYIEHKQRGEISAEQLDQQALKFLTDAVMANDLARLQQGGGLEDFIIDLLNTGIKAAPLL